MSMFRVVTVLGIFMFQGALLWAANPCDSAKVRVKDILSDVKDYNYSNPSLSYELIIKAEKLIEDCDAQEEKALIRFSLGDYYYMIGDLEKSIQMYSDEILALDEAEFPELRAESQLAIGRIYSKTGLQQISIEYYKRAYDYWVNSGNLERQSTALMNIAYSYFLSGEPDSAIHESYKVLEILDQIEVGRNHSFGYTQMAEFYFAIQAYDSALTYLQRAERFIDQFDNNWERSRSSILKAQIYIQLDDIVLAKKEAENALDLNSRYSINIDDTELYHTLYQIYRVEDPISAMEFLELSVSNRDSLKQVEVTQQIGALNTYKATVEQELNQLRLENELQEFQFILTISIVFLFSVVVICIILFIAVKKNQRKREIIHQQNQELRSSNLMRSKLFALVSHDFKSPLNQILGLLTLLDNEQISVEEFKKYSGQLREHTERTIELTQTILQWSKSQLKKEEISASPILLRDLIHFNLSLERIRIKDKGIQTQVEIPEDMEVSADYSMLSLAFNNLISNAVKYSFQGGTVRIRAEEQGSYARVCFMDTGSGISKEVIDKLFDTQLTSKPGTAQEQGTGIGLLLTHDLIKLNNGKISVSSIPKQGTEICVTLPLS